MAKSRDNEILGRSFDAARRELVKQILWDLACKTGQGDCFRCGKPIDWASLSIDHEKDWRSSENPVGDFFNLANIRFSHLGCNAAAADKTNAIAAKRAITHCPHGHEYTLENTRWNQGKRQCRACGNIRNGSRDRREYRREYYQRTGK